METGNPHAVEREKFRKLTKRQKLALPYPPDKRYWEIYEGKVKVYSVIFIPNGKKMDGYGMATTFIETDAGIEKYSEYDCFQFITEGTYMLHGDFEYGGVVFFLDGRCGFATNRFLTK